MRPLFGIGPEWTRENDAMMFGDDALGRQARELRLLRGADVTECQRNAEAAAMRYVEDAVHEVAHGGVVPKSAACLFARGRNDPVLEPQYIDAFYAHLKARTTSSVEWHLFEKSQHAMAIVEAPDSTKPSTWSVFWRLCQNSGRERRRHE